MARLPNFFNIYDVANVVHRNPQAGGFRGYGSDGSESGDNVFYIGSEINERMVSFKSFISDLTLEFSKDGKFETSAESSQAVYQDFSGRFGFKVTIDIPAHSVYESANNLAKISELQRMIVPFDTSYEILNPANETNVPAGQLAVHTFKNILLVFFKNIINNGRADSYSTNIRGYGGLRNVGLACFIENISYEPDITFGFFEHPNGRLYPKLIQLTLTINPDTEYPSFGQPNPQTGKALLKPIVPFNSNGHYNSADSCFFPFLVKSKNALLEARDILQVNFEGAITEQQMNTFDLTPGEINSHSTFIFIGLPLFYDSADSVEFYPIIGNEATSSDTNPSSNDGTSQRARAVVFKFFMESFTREVVSKTTALKDDSKGVLNQAGANFTLEAPSYDFKFNVPSMSLEEAKKNCAKVQLLLRMFYKKKDVSGRNLNDNDLTMLKVFIPSILEKGGFTERYVNRLGRGPEHISGMFERAVNLIPEQMTIDIDSDFGFFEEGDKIYPKSFSIAFQFRDVETKNYKQIVMQGNNASLVGQDPPDELKNFKDGYSHLFPDNIKYFNVRGK